MIIKSSIKEYEVIINNDFDFLDSLFSEENAMFIIDEKLYKIYRNELFSTIKCNQLILINALETEKNIDTVLKICESMTKIPAKRNAHLISIGGGIIQDITGFVANILYRGIHWTFLPTTLLAACDSCIGGKTSLNYKNYKNLLGTFYPPDVIHICPKFFHSLSNRDFESGLGEIVKFNLMNGQIGISKIEMDIDDLKNRQEMTLNEYINNSLMFKKKFIEEDEFDKGIRVYLNFAHTFGHAFESVSNYMIPHGTAVAMGMVIANRISLLRGFLNKKIVERMESILFSIIHIEFDIKNMDFSKFINAIRKDKKQTSNDLTAVLMYDDMNLKIIHDLREDEIKTALQFIVAKIYILQ